MQGEPEGLGQLVYDWDHATDHERWTITDSRASQAISGGERGGRVQGANGQREILVDRGGADKVGLSWAQES